MFSIGKTVALFSLVAGVFASPLSSMSRRDSSSVSLPNISFNNWGGLSSLSGFDDFYGSDDFFGSRTEQVIIIEEEEDSCRDNSVRIIQQQLAILQEFAKRIISEQSCDVETQIIVLEQFRGSLGSFGSDLRRKSGRSIGYDESVSELIIDLVNSDGSFNSHDFGFDGSDIGQHLIVPSGSNWNDQTSPNNINSILQTIHNSTHQ